MGNFGCFPTFPIFSYQSVQNNSEWPILAVFQLFQYFPTEVVQNNSEWPILAIFFSKEEENKFQLPLFTCLILINLAIECSLIFIYVSLKEHNLVHQDRINSLPSNGLQMWPLPFSEKRNITIAIKNMTHSAIYEC